MKKLWVAEGTRSLRVYFYSDDRDVRRSALQALTEKDDDEFLEWSPGQPTEITSVAQIDSLDVKNDEGVYLVGSDEDPDSLRGWIVKAQEIDDLLKQKQREAEAAARQMRLFGDDGT